MRVSVDTTLLYKVMQTLHLPSQQSTATMKTEGIAVILVLAAWQAGANQEKKKSEISLFDPFSIQAPHR